MEEKKFPLVRQLGNGGAFDFDSTNTSFTLYDDQILVDCGYNVFSKLMTEKDEDGKIIGEKIKYIFITHEHDDHIGSLMSYLYYTEFVLKKRVDVYLPWHVYDVLRPILEKGIWQYPTGEKKEFEYINIHILDKRETVEKLCLAPTDIWFTPDCAVNYLTARSHGNFYNTSYVFYFNKYKYIVGISGDMKANKEFEEMINNLQDRRSLLDNIKGRVIFHDYSNVDSVYNIHATKRDIEEIYSETFRKDMIKVHNNNNLLITLMV